MKYSGAHKWKHKVLGLPYTPAWRRPSALDNFLFLLLILPVGPIPNHFSCGIYNYSTRVIRAFTNYFR